MPPPPEDSPPERVPLVAAPETNGAVAKPPVATQPYWEHCTDIWQHRQITAAPFNAALYGPIVPTPDAIPPPVGGAHANVSAPLSGAAGGGGHPAVWLAIAVIVVAALPIVVYVVDDDADPLTHDRFYCPEFSFSGGGGVQAPANGTSPAIGLMTSRVRATVGYFGVDATADIAPQVDGVGAFSAHFLLRPLSKAHIEGALAIGVRRQAGPGGMLDGFDLALPHQYVFWRSGYRSLSLELVPRMFINRKAVDAGLDGNFLIPIVDALQLRVGGTVFSHAGATQFGASTGFTVFL